MADGDLELMEDGWKPAQPHGHEKIWRYIDFSQFVSLLKRRQLWLCRASDLADPYEGVLPTAARRALGRDLASELGYHDLDPEEFGELGYAGMRQMTFVNSWHADEDESAAMWQLYNENGKEIAVVTSVQALRDGVATDGLDGSVEFGRVEYVDYADISSFPRHPHAPYFHKRESFEHEAEFRIVHQDFSYAPPTMDSPDEFVGAVRERAPGGKPVGIDVEAVIDEVHVSPVADDWLSGFVEELLDEEGLLGSVTVEESSIETPPEPL